MSASVHLHGGSDHRCEVIKLRGGEPFLIAATGDVTFHFPGTGDTNLRHAREFAMAILGALVNYGGGLPPVVADVPAPVEEEYPL